MDQVEWTAPIAADENKSEAAPFDVRLIAFYLPQFHPIEENDRWWGPGFTDWRNVVRATPLFDGHYQPHLPGALGFYDLRIDEVRRKQVELARAHGIHGFCYYYYWFNGRRILERPLNSYVADASIDFPFCICWANENWSRRWDGGNREVLLVQEHDIASDMEFIREVIPLFKDPRYIHVNGMPLLVLYRADLLKNPAATAAGWREECEKAGLPGIHLCAAQTFDISDPRPFGFDSAVEFPPHRHAVGQITQDLRGLPGDFNGWVCDYELVARHSLTAPAPDYPLYRGLFPSWDNTARKRQQALIFHNADPHRYEYWLRGLVEYTRQNMVGDQRVIFINAWNEWAEGAHLEPDVFWGRAYLEVTRDVLRERFGWREPVPDQAVPHHPQTVATADLYNDLYEKFVSLQETSSGFLSYADRRVRELKQHYEARLEQARLEADQVTELNDWLCEQLHLQSGRLQELAVEHVFPTDWLGVGPPAPSGEGAREEGAEQDDGRTAAPPAETHDHDEAPRELANEDAVARNAQKGKRKAQKARRKAYEAKEAEERRRDEGFEEPPRTPTPLWLVELDASD